jgi:DNA repair protein RecN (Recombination protein N)
VIATFELPAGHSAHRFLQDQDLPHDEDLLILRRTLSADGRSKAFINDQPVSATLLSRLGEYLVEIHGQFETHGLLNPATHLSHLDDYARIKELARLSELYKYWREAEDHVMDAEAKAKRAREEESYIRGCLQDLDALAPQEEEEESLSELRTRLMNREQVLEALNTAYEALNGDHDPVNLSLRTLERIADKTGESLNQAMEALERADAELQEASAIIQSLSADLQDSEYNLQEIDDRLFALKDQARKHGCSISELPQKREELAERLQLIEAGDDILGELMRAAKEARQKYYTLALAVSEERQAAAQKLDQEVARELPPLKMDKASFVTEVIRLEESEWGPQGIDKVRFLVATNPGASPGPLAKIASGGEMARFMLALKVILAEVGAPQTLVFDEVDSGIGGATADAVGERLARLGDKRQVLVVTHSPQVAARAAHHWIVEKNGTSENVNTNVVPLQGQDHRCEEIARMLSGAQITEEARKAATKLLEGRAA